MSDITFNPLGRKNIEVPISPEEMERWFKEKLAHKPGEPGTYLRIVREAYMLGRQEGAGLSLRAAFDSMPQPALQAMEMQPMGTPVRVRMTGDLLNYSPTQYMHEAPVTGDIYWWKGKCCNVHHREWELNNETGVPVLTLLLEE